jgi:outer membrane protein TolC
MDGSFKALGARVCAATFVVAAIGAFALRAKGQDAPQMSVQLAQPGGAGQMNGGQSSAPVVVTLQDAIARARKIDAQYLGAADDVRNVREDRLQARNAMLPSASATSQYLGTQGNGKIPSGRFVTNDGVHVYRAWGVFRQDLSPVTYLGISYRRASAAEALAQAKAEIAQRGLTVTVTKNYYGFAAAQRKYAAAQQALDQARHFLQITQDLERSGQIAHADVVKAQIQAEQQQQAFDEAGLAMEDARLGLAVLLFPTLNENFSVVDDLAEPARLPGFADLQAMAGKQNPDLRAAMETLREADQDVAAAKGAFLPSFSVEMEYGIEANHFALRSVVSADPLKGPVPNLGYFVTAGVTIPVWDWGTLRSKLHQAETSRERAQTELNQSQRTTLANLYSAFNEASVAREAVESARRASELGAESLGLVNLRYQAGESTALEVVDAQNTASLTSTAFADAQVRYRVALASLQMFTGNF